MRRPPLVLLVLLVLAALFCSGCGSPFTDHRSPDERWADKVCSALGDWHQAQTSGANSGELVTLRDEGHLSHASMMRALRPGVEANPRLIAAIRAAGRPPVSDAASLSRQLGRMVRVETSHLQRAYAIAEDESIPPATAYDRIQTQLAAVERADANRGIVNLRWYQLTSCQALV